METSESQQQKISKSSNTDVDPSHVLQSAWIRCLVCFDNQINRIICGNRYYFLLHFNYLFLVILHVIQKKIMNY